MKSKLQQVKDLIKSGIDINGLDANASETPLMKAVKYGDLRIVKFLVENGALIDKGNINININLNEEQYISEIEEENVKNESKYKSIYNYKDPILTAIYYEKYKILDYLLDNCRDLSLNKWKIIWFKFNSNKNSKLFEILLKNYLNNNSVKKIIDDSKESPTEKVVPAFINVSRYRKNLDHYHFNRYILFKIEDIIFYKICNMNKYEVDNAECYKIDNNYIYYLKIFMKYMYKYNLICYRQTIARRLINPAFHNFKLAKTFISNNSKIVFMKYSHSSGECENLYVYMRKLLAYEYINLLRDTKDKDEIRKYKKYKEECEKLKQFIEDKYFSVNKFDSIFKSSK